MKYSNNNNHNVVARAFMYTCVCVLFRVQCIEHITQKLKSIEFSNMLVSLIPNRHKQK